MIGMLESRGLMSATTVVGVGSTSGAAVVHDKPRPPPPQTYPIDALTDVLVSS